MELKKLFKITLLLISDFVSITLSVILGFYLYTILNIDYSILKIYDYLPLIIFSPIIYFFFGLYSTVCYSLIAESKKIIYSILTIFSFFATYTFLSKETEDFSRLFFSFSLIISIPILPLFRYYVRLFLGRINFFRTNVIIFGAGNTGQKIYSLLDDNRYIGLRPVLFFDKRAKQISKIDSIDILEGIENAGEYIDKVQARYGILAIPSLPKEEKREIIDLYADRFIQFIIIPNLYGISSLWIDSIDFAGQLGLQIKHKLILRRYKFLKRTFDFCASFFGLLFISPLLLIIWTLIKVSSKGPAIYSHKRYGHRGKSFPAYKFRSMVNDADKILQDYLDKNPEQKKEWEEDQKLKNDPRITWIGNILRKTSLDELPQLFNVLKGEMSLVGPRPIVKNEIEKYGLNYFLYKRVRPGITGLWQVSGRNNTTYKERIDYDCYYVRNWSLSLDLYLLFRTVKVVLFREGAY